MIELTVTNVLQLMSTLMPVMITFFMLMLSLMNQNVKGIVFIAGALLASFLNLFLRNAIQSEQDPNASITCTLIDIPYMNRYNSPSSDSVYLAFTFAYLFLPMNYNSQMNYAIITALFIMFAIDATAKVTNKCTTVGGVVIGALVGFLLGALWYTIFHMVGADNLLYFEETQSNGTRCERPDKQTFKCSVYKNGQLISSSIA